MGVGYGINCLGTSLAPLGAVSLQRPPLPTCRLVCLESSSAVRGLWTPPTSLLCGCLTLAAELGIWQQLNPQCAIRGSQERRRRKDVVQREGGGGEGTQPLVFLFQFCHLETT